LVADIKVEAQHSWLSYPVLLVGLAAVFYLPGVLSPRDFWAQDEARYAEVIREMVVDHQWVVPHLNGEYYAHKPPLYFWLCALVSVVTGDISPASCMVVTWLSAVGCLLATYSLGKYLLGERPAFFGTMVLMSSALFLTGAQIVRMDMLLTCFVVLSLYAFIRGYREKRARWYVLFYVFVTLGVFAKGPFGLVLPFVASAGFLVARRQWRRLVRFVVSPGMALLLVTVGGWLTAMWALGHRDYVENILFKQVAGRALGSWDHPEPFYYYVWTLPLLFLPWTPFVPGALARAWRAMDRDVFAILIAWFGADYLVLSAVSTKLAIYLLPVLPPLAILAGWILHEAWERQGGWTKGFMLAGALAALATFGVLGAASPAARLSSRFAPFGSLVSLMTIACVPILLALLACLVARKRRMFLALLFVGMVAVSVSSFGVIASRLNPVLSSRDVGNDIRKHMNEGRTVGTARLTRGILDFYAGAVLVEVDDQDSSAIVGYLNGHPERVVVAKDSLHDKRLPQLDQSIVVLGRHTIAFQSFVLLGAQTPSPAARP
jgi:4-amino-4-deoxy-L-arabinose transferase-like glycosyltransferase